MAKLKRKITALIAFIMIMMLIFLIIFFLTIEPTHEIKKNLGKFEKLLIIILLSIMLILFLIVFLFSIKEVFFILKLNFWKIKNKSNDLIK